MARVAAALALTWAPLLAHGLKDGLDAQLFPCDPLSVRQTWRLTAAAGSDGLTTTSGHLHLQWAGVDPPLTQTLVHLTDGQGPHPRLAQAGQLATWALHGSHPSGAAQQRAGAPAPTNCSGAPRRLGCFGDNAVDRMLSGQTKSGPVVSQSACATFCRNPKWPGGPYNFMAVEDTNQCFCGRTKKPATGVHTPGPAWCTSPTGAACTHDPGSKDKTMCCCAGNASQTCGAVGFLELFDVSGVTCKAAPAPDLWSLSPVAAEAGGVAGVGLTKLVNVATRKCAASLGCNWTTQTRNCHDNNCHDNSACPVVLGDCGTPAALWAWNASTGTLRHHLGDASKPTLSLCLDAGTTYPNTACGFGLNADQAFCDAALPTAQRARDLITRMTLPEQLNQLLTEAPAIPRLGIGRYQYWGEVRGAFSCSCPCS